MLEAIREYTVARWFWTDWIGITLVMSAGSVLMPSSAKWPRLVRWPVRLVLAVLGQIEWRFYG